MYIDGKMTGQDLAKVQVRNPATNEVVGTVPNGGKEEAKEAVRQRMPHSKNGRGRRRTNVHLI